MLLSISSLTFLDNHGPGDGEGTHSGDWGTSMIYGGYRPQTTVRFEFQEGSLWSARIQRAYLCETNGRCAGSDATSRIIGPTWAPSGSSRPCFLVSMGVDTEKAEPSWDQQLTEAAADG
ncbi:hypothetical protein BU26DRAFT_184162 [Trematosphaeria pertusa]|uniref:Uncharacterized protein n=1 Tax=Trematosphaeria pertusa TaxID=390896 RepID=A0A6A6HU44_9PLEO|nr:uncharacterized protein BU26DRAFT_184162 [Trematosphaeria pertusa]KAF2241278.1 hypothetical protein BU26DRAFT_184162 [Trematosphaeria pertusa]